MTQSPKKGKNLGSRLEPRCIFSNHEQPLQSYLYVYMPMQSRQIYIYSAYVFGNSPTVPTNHTCRPFKQSQQIGMMLL